jgi:GDP/UDP-N,N'-diacetylbacillosamine 2-epimerase (hydrolysing)
MRNICVYTSTRAEYGLLRNLIRQIHEDPALRLVLLVSGTHLTADQGMTIEEIRKEGFVPDHCVDIELSDDSPKGICHSMGIAVSEYGKFLNRYRPDIVVILGDRFEAFCCAAAAQICRIPIAHIHGGETTQGSIDEAFRHSITKMAHLHFPCCDVYRQRIIQMGEDPEHVYNVGSLGVENIRKISFMDQKKLEVSINFNLDQPFFLITFHPVTLEKDTSKDQFAALLGALNLCSDHKFIFTGSNADPGGQAINQMLTDYRNSHPDKCLVVPSLGLVRYLSAMKLCRAVIGNSSSGMIEAPALKIPSINIGDRQKGRIRTQSIIDCEPSIESIGAALKRISDPSFQEDVKNMIISFEKPEPSKKIKGLLSKAELSNIIKKVFCDIEYQSL